jgi:hypothetical protein
MDIIQPFSLIENTWNLKELMSRNQLILLHSDHFSDNSCNYLLTLAEKKLKEHNTDLRTKKKIINIMIEAVQNISKHGCQDKDNTVSPLLAIGCSQPQNGDGEKPQNGDAEKSGTYFIITGNTITKGNKDYLNDRLDYLNSLTPEELKEYYMHTLRYHMITDNGGAGLGFLDMIRKSQNKLKYHFAPLSNKHYFFSFKVDICDSAVAA